MAASAMGPAVSDIAYSMAQLEQSVTSGAESLDEAAGRIQASLNKFEQSLQDFAKKMQQRAADVAAGTKFIINEVSSFSQRLMNLARQGFAGTVEANRLGLAWQLLARQLAAVAIPVVDALTNGMMRLTGFFRGLSGDGQNLSLVAGLIAGAIRPLMMAMPILATAFKAIWAALTPFNALLAIVVTGLVEFFTTTKEGQAIFELLGAVLQNVVMPVVQALTNIFTFLAQCVSMAFQAITRAIEWVIVKIAGLVEDILDWIPGMGDATAAVKAFKDKIQARLDSQNEAGFGNNKSPQDKARRDVTLSSGRFEGVGGAFQRVTETANKFAGGPEQARHDEAMKKQDKLIEAVKGVREEVKNQDPAVGK